MEKFRYQLDCDDMTFDRKGDFSGFSNKVWLNVDDNPTAKAVADRYCPIIETLNQQETEDESYYIIEAIGRQSIQP